MEQILRRLPVEEIESPLDGNEIMGLLGIPPSPRIEDVKEYLVDEILEGRLTPGDKETARRFVNERFGE
jgi:poly(A) polymerase